MAAKNPIPSGVSKADYMEFKFDDALVESDNFDLLVMGRTQGKGCYCFVNGLLQAQIQRLEKNYPYIIVDNEAGMEHISRGVLPNMETAILVSDCRPADQRMRYASKTGRPDCKPGSQWRAQ